MLGVKSAYFPVVDRRYILVGQIGAGGMGVVYRAKDRLTEQPVALKSVSSDWEVAENDGAFLDRRLALAEEFQTLASIRHPNIISVIDYGFDASRQPYFTMDLLDKPETILQVAQRTPSLTGKINLLLQAFQAIAYLNRRGIVHRDLKPGNILVQDGQVKLLDFGLATAKREFDAIIGTPAYIAPEVLNGESVTPASDLYAMGVIMYEIFTGRHPFRRINMDHLLASIVHEKPTPTHLLSESNRTQIVTDIPTTNEEDTDNTADERQSDVLPTNPLTDFKTRLFVEKPSTQDTLDVFDATSVPLFTIDPTAEQAQTLTQERGLFDVVQRLLKANPRERYQTADEVIRALEALLGKESPTETGDIRDSFLQAAKFVGRQAEHGQLVSALKQAINGVGGIFLVSGENGIGKSRLLDELRISALVSGVFVLRGRAAELDGPYQIWREPIRRLVLNTELSDYDAGVLKEMLPDIDDLLERPISAAPTIEPDQSSKRLLSVINSLFNHQKHPTLILLEDLHWARAENLIVLEQIVQQINTLPLLIVGSYRTDEQFELAPTLSALPTLHLKRFAPAEIVSLTTSMIGEPDQRESLNAFLLRETEGNPLFIIEVMRALAEETGTLSTIGLTSLPPDLMVEGIQRLLQRRLARLPVEDKTLLQIAATLGREIDLKVLHAVTPDADFARWLLRCSDAAVLEIHDEQWQFSHDKLRQEIIREIPAQEIKGVYRRAALGVEAVYPNEASHAVLLIRLWAEIGDVVKERYYAAVAGEQAMRSGIYQEALAYLERADSLLRKEMIPHASGAAVLHAKVLMNLANASMFIGNYDNVRRYAQESIEIGSKLDDSAIHAEALFLLGMANLYQGDAEGANKLLEQSLTLSRLIKVPHIVTNALRGLARISSARGDYALASQYLEESRQISEQINNTWDVAITLSDLGYISGMQGEFERSEHYLQQSLSLYRSINSRDGTASILLLLGNIKQFQGEVSQTIDYWLESLSIANEIGDRRAAADALNNLGSYASRRQEFEDAKTWLSQSLSIYREVNFRWGIIATLINLGHVATGLNDLTTANTYFHQAMQHAHELQATPMMLEIISGVARIMVAEGDLQQAAQWAGLVSNHPAINPDIMAVLNPLLDDLKAKVTLDHLQRDLEAGKMLTIDEVSVMILHRKL